MDFWQYVLPLLADEMKKAGIVLMLMTNMSGFVAVSASIGCVMLGM